MSCAIGEFGRLQLFVLGCFESGALVDTRKIVRCMRVSRSAAGHAIRALVRRGLAQLVQRQASSTSPEVYGSTDAAKVVIAQYRGAIALVMKGGWREHGRQVRSEWGRLALYAIGCFGRGEDVTPATVAEAMDVTDNAARQTLRKLVKAELARVVRTQRPDSARGSEIKVYAGTPAALRIADEQRDEIAGLMASVGGVVRVRPAPPPSRPVQRGRTHSGSGVIAGPKLIRGYVF